MSIERLFSKRWLRFLAGILSAIAVVIFGYLFFNNQAITISSASSNTHLDPPLANTASKTCPVTRDQYIQPFHPESIWNRPIGSNAQYVDAGLERGRAVTGITLDEDMIILAPSAPKQRLTTTGWSSDKRCNTDGEDLYSGLQVPIPDNYETTFHGITPNMSGAILLEDGEHILQNQPLHVCRAGGPAGSAFKYPTVTFDAKEESKWGAHGGSSLSSIGGTLRCGEMTRANPHIHHALKINVFAKKYLLQCSLGKPYDDSLIYRADAYACSDEPIAYGGDNPAVRMGSLLALKPDFDLSSLRTEPGRILAQAFIEYGAYIVDDTARNVYAIPTAHEVIEQPDGFFRVCNFAEQFQAEWGAKFNQRQGSFAHDFHTIVENLYSVVNNIKNPDSIYGEPDPQPGAPKGWAISRTAGGGAELSCFASPLESVEK
ncbi:MAG: hypothetical protein AAGD09_08315 [Cyanobacteria bacterium P01_F01_bin.56]